MMSLVSNVDQNETSQKFCSEQSPVHRGDMTCESFPVNYNRKEVLVSTPPRYTH